MKEFIDSFGLNNFVIIVAVVVAILLALLIIFILEKIAKRKKNDVLDYYDTFDNDDDEIIEENETQNNVVKPTVELAKKEEVVYKEDVITEQEAKKTLEEVTKKLVEEEQAIIGPTRFEMEQEEKSVISYDELKKINYDIDEVNDNVLLDEGDLPITIEELYKKHLDEQESNKDEALNPIFVEADEEIKKFKNSEIISPVFGVYRNDVKRNVPKKQNLESTVDLADLEIEIKKTEEFLKELKRLKDKLE